MANLDSMDESSFTQSMLSETQRLRLDFLWQSGELREREKNLRAGEIALENSKRAENKRRETARYNSYTGKIEDHTHGLLGSIVSGIAPDSIGDIDFPEKLEHDTQLFTKKQYQRKNNARLIIWGRGAYEYFDERATYICEKYTVSFYEEALWLLIHSERPEDSDLFIFAEAIADETANEEQIAHFQKLEKLFKREEKKRKRKLILKKIKTFITPSITWASWPFFAATLFMNITIEPFVNPWIPFIIAFYVKKIIMLVIVIIAAFFFTDLFGDVFSYFFN
jgi:hypothetical protein